MTPTAVVIGAITYAVTQRPDDWMRIEHEIQSKGFYGHTKHTTAVIYLNPEASPEVTRLTLWHEVLHALIEVCAGSPEWRGLGKDKNAREEAIIRYFESPTLLVLRDNPDLVAYLTAKPR